MPACAIYLIHYGVFGDSYFILKDFISSVAFVPIFYLISTIIIDRSMASREKRETLYKLNVVIGAFYSEFGTDAFGLISPCLDGFGQISQKLSCISAWDEKEFADAAAYIKTVNYAINCKVCDLEKIRTYFFGNRDFLLAMMQNPNLMEHETFTDMLLAVFHAHEELSARNEFTGLPESDLNHLSQDIKRAHTLMIVEWVLYMRHLKKEYPYIFSLSARKNPFNGEARIIVT